MNPWIAHLIYRCTVRYCTVQCEVAVPRILTVGTQEYCVYSTVRSTVSNRFSRDRSRTAIQITN